MRKSRNVVQATLRGANQRVAQRLGHRISVLVLAVAAVSSTGCSLFNAMRYQDHWDETVSKYRYRSYSSKSWHRHKNQFCNEPNLDDFCAGFRQGYEDVANGGSGCTPNFPPREYWGWQYQSGYGQKQVAAWFAGYPHGARAAEEEGLGSWSQIQMSSGLQSQYANTGVLPSVGHGVYPITDGVNVNPNIGAPTPAGPLGGPAGGPIGIQQGAPLGSPLGGVVPNGLEQIPPPAAIPPAGNRLIN